MHVSEESDSGIVPMKPSNKDGSTSVEKGEGRPLIKENTHQLSTHSTQSEVRVSQGLAGVRKAARERKEMKFTALLPSKLENSKSFCHREFYNVSSHLPREINSPVSIATHSETRTNLGP